MNEGVLGKTRFLEGRVGAVSTLLLLLASGFLLRRGHLSHLWVQHDPNLGPSGLTFSTSHHQHERRTWNRFPGQKGELGDGRGKGHT